MGTDNQNSQEVTQTAEPKLFTQEEVNEWLAKDRRKTAEKYADYESLKEKAAKFDEIEEANKSELEKANEQIASLTAQLDGIKKAEELRDLRTKIATENHIPVELLTGATEEECNAQVSTIKGVLEKNGIPIAVNDSGEVIHTGKLDPGTAFANWAKDKL